MKTFLSSSIILLLTGANLTVNAQKESAIPVDYKILNKSISDKKLVGSLELPSMEINSSTISEMLSPKEGCDITPPKNLSELTGGWKMFFYQMNLDTAAKVGVISLGEASTNIGKDVYIYEQMYYKDVSNCDAGKVTYGSGVRLTILAKKLEAGVNLSNLGAIAASAEMKKAEVTVTMSTIGLSGPKVNQLIPPAGSYNVEKHVQYLQAIDGIKALINDSTTVVTPEIISLTIPESQNLEFVKASYITFALERIAKRESYNTARTRFKVWDDLTESMLKQVYQSIVKATDDTRPSQIHSLQAKEILSNTN